MISEGGPRGCSIRKVFLKYGEIHRKTPTLESLFNKVADLRVRCFPPNFAMFLRTLILLNFCECWPLSFDLTLPS